MCAISPVFAILSASQFERYEKKPNPWAYLSSNPPKGHEIKSRWAELLPELEREQNRLLKDFEEWHSDFCGLFQNVTKDEDRQLQKLYLDMDSWIKYRQVSGLPKSVDEAIKSFTAICDQFSNFLDKIEPANKFRSILVVDTSAIINCPDISQISTSLNLSGAIFVIPSTTISELDNLKTMKRDDEFRQRLKAAIHYLEETMANGDDPEGVQLADGSILKMLAVEPDFSKLPEWLDPEINDDRILAAAIELQIGNPVSFIAILTNDINMKNKANLAGIPVKKVPDLFEAAA
jgi:rRNA-processing protein FCF1